MPELNASREKRILAAASELISHYGYDKTTVDDIARAAGISKGAVYLHFRSKEQLFEALLMRESDALIARYFERLEADPKGLTLFNIYRYGLEVIDDSPLIRAIYTRDRRVIGDYLRHIRDSAAYSEVASFSIEAVQQFQQAGLMREDVDAESVAYLLSALRYGLFTMEDYNPKGQAPPISQLGATLATLLDSGLAPREGTQHSERVRETLAQLLAAKVKFLEQRQDEEHRHDT